VLRLGEDAKGASIRLREAGIEAQLLDPSRQTEVLPGLVPPGDKALYESGAGAIRSAAAIDALSGSLGGRIVGTTVMALESSHGGVTIVTSEGIWQVEKALLCAGTGTAALARSLGLTIPLRLTFHPRAKFLIRERNRDVHFACLQDGSGYHGESVYGGPADDGRHYVVGLIGADLSADQAHTLGDVQGVIQRISRYVERALPSLDPAPVGVRVCATTKLPAGKDAFAVWATGDVVTIAGNNLFKFAPSLGPLLARAVLDGAVPSLLPDGDEVRVRQIR
jgi:sarcosine oxidase